METLATKDKIVQLGAEYIQTFGYHSFKYRQIASALNIKNASIHHYFPSKEDLGLAVVEKSNAAFLERSINALNLSARQKIQTMISLYSEYVSKGFNLCLLGVCISAYTELPQKMQEAAKKYYTDIVTWLSIVFDEGKEAGDFVFVGSSEDLAQLWLATIAGSIQMAKMKGKDDFEKSIQRLQSLYLPGAAHQNKSNN